MPSDDGTVHSRISTHILDTSRGEPAAGVAVGLECRNPGDIWSPLGSGTTNADGRIPSLLPGKPLSPGTYRLRFETGPYFTACRQDAFFPYVEVVFTIDDPGRRHHIPLLLSPFGYSTYRGS